MAMYELGDGTFGVWDEADRAWYLLDADMKMVDSCPLGGTPYPEWVMRISSAEKNAQFAQSAEKQEQPKPAGDGSRPGPLSRLFGR